MAADDPPQAPSAAPWHAVPQEAAAIIRPGLGDLVEEMLGALRAEVPEYDQPLEGEFGRLIREGVTVALDQFVGLLGRDAPPPDLRVYEGIGRAELRAGRTLDALQAAYRIGARVAWRGMVAVGEGRLPPQALLTLGEAIFAYIDRLADASVTGYVQEQAVSAGSLQSRRQALVELLLAGPVADPEALAQVTEDAAWVPPAQLAVLLVGAGEPVAIARRLPTGTIGAWVAPHGVLLVPDPDAPGRAAQLATATGRHRGVLGPSVPWAQTHRSAARARTAWPLHDAGRLGDAPLARTADHLLDLALAGDPALGRELADDRLAPLLALAPAARERAEATLRAWLDAHGDVTRTAAALHVHPQTVRYRLAGLREVLGDALDSPLQRLELAAALRAGDLLAPTDLDATDA